MLPRTGFTRGLILLLGVFCLLILATSASGELVEQDIDYHVDMVEGSEGEGFEPHILAGPGIDGTEWYYIDSPTGLGGTQGGNLFISKDHGDTWQWYDKDTALAGSSGDSYTVIGPEGQIYFTDLYLATASVDTSLDGGETWYLNPLASVYVGDDRQWLDMGPTAGGGGNTIYFTFNNVAGGLVMVKSDLSETTGVPVDWHPCNNGLAIAGNVMSRDNFVVNRDDGTIYIANFQQDDGLYMYVSTNGCQSFSNYRITDNGVHPENQNTFVIPDVDSEGNLYVMWSSRAHIHVAVSTDKGQSWTVHQVTETPGTRVLPWVAAGDTGRIGMIYYETPAEGDPNHFDNTAIWNLSLVISTNALDPEPSFRVTNVHPEVHYGSVRTSNPSGSPDRDLGDFVGVDVDSLGRLIANYGFDGDDGVGARQAVIMFARQEEGPFLREDVGPVADFSHTVDELTVRVDASTSYARAEGANLTSFIWDWGDGTNASFNDTRASHAYAGEGSYNITLKVVSSSGLSARVSFTVTLKEEATDFNLYWLLGGATLILLIAAIVATERGKGKEES